MLIDTCASGGKRLDLETLRRSVPLWRSDYIVEPVGPQNHTYGLSLWVPFHGTGTNNWNTVCQDAYCLRSTFGPAWNCLWDVRRKDLDYDTMRRMFAELRQIAPLMLEDYYPLSAYSVQDDVWISWQYCRPSTGTGIVMAFRRGESPYDSATFQLRGLEADANYTVADADRGKKQTKTGRELMEQGLTITMERKPDSALIWIQREQ